MSSEKCSNDGKPVKVRLGASDCMIHESSQLIITDPDAHIN
jgi:hypothetical protein